MSPCVLSAASKRCRSSSCSWERSYGVVQDGDPKFTTSPHPPKDGALRTPSNLPQNPLVPNLELSLKGIASALHRLQLPAQRLALLPQPLLHLPPTPKQTP